MQNYPFCLLVLDFRCDESLDFILNSLLCPYLGALETTPDSMWLRWFSWASSLGLLSKSHLAYCYLFSLLSSGHSSPNRWIHHKFHKNSICLRLLEMLHQQWRPWSFSAWTTWTKSVSLISITNAIDSCCHFVHCPVMGWLFYDASNLATFAFSHQERRSFSILDLEVSYQKFKWHSLIIPLVCSNSSWVQLTDFAMPFWKFARILFFFWH